MKDFTKNVVVLGASSNPERFSNRAIKMLLNFGHNVIPVHPLEKEIEGLAVVPSLREVDQPIDTITLYVAPKNIVSLIPQIIAAKPRRVIANPGTESEELARALSPVSIPYIRACTLIMLQTDQWE